jgi:hypothetical protein
MKRIYSVIIQGRTLESRDLKELLARAVSEKKKRDRILSLQDCSPVPQIRTPFGVSCRSEM